MTQSRTVPELAAATGKLARAQQRDDLADAVDAAAAAFARGHLTLAVAGEFKRGKSSLINALIDEPKLLPVDTTIATSVVTTISYADSERAAVLVAGEPEPKLIARDEIAEYVTEGGNPRNVRDVQLVTIELPNDKLRRGLVIADTPGVGGIARDHAAVTYAFLLSADLVLFVLDALAPLSTAELDFIASIHERTGALVFAVTKIDQEAAYETLVENTRAKLASVLDVAPASIPVVPVSSLAKLDFLESGDPEDLEASNFPALEAALWTLLHERGEAALMARTVAVITRTVDSLSAPLQAELDAYGERSEPELEQQQQQLQADAMRVGELVRLDAAWRATLRADFVHERAALDKRLEAGVGSVRYELIAVLEEERVLDDPSLAVGRIDSAVAAVAAELSTVLAGRKAALAHRVSTVTAVTLIPPVREVALDVGATAPGFSAERTRSDMGDKILQGVSALPQGATIGGTAAYAIVTLLSVSNPVGWVVLGTALGAGAILSRETRQMRNQDSAAGRTDLERVMQRYIDECASQLRTGLDWAWNQVEEDLESGMDEALRVEHRRLGDSATALADGRRRNADEIAARVDAVRDPIAKLEAIRGEALRHRSPAHPPRRLPPPDGAA